MTAEQQKAFDDFWKERWPKCRRIDKKKAADQWARIDPALYPMIHASLERQKKQPSWITGDCKFIPYPHRWLRDRRWEDEIALPEDTDAELLIGELAKHGHMPSDFPRHMLERFVKMCRNKETNWGRLHARIGIDPEAEKKIKADYLATE